MKEPRAEPSVRLPGADLSACLPAPNPPIKVLGSGTSAGHGELTLLISSFLTTNLMTSQALESPTNWSLCIAWKIIVRTRIHEAESIKACVCLTKLFTSFWRLAGFSLLQSKENCCLSLCPVILTTKSVKAPSSSDYLSCYIFESKAVTFSQ